MLVRLFLFLSCALNVNAFLQAKLKSFEEISQSDLHMKTIRSNSSSDLVLDVHFIGFGRNFDLTLVEDNDFFGDKFTIYFSKPSTVNKKLKGLINNTIFKGSLKGDSYSHVIASFNGNDLFIYITTKLNSFYVEPKRRLNSSYQGANLIIYDTNHVTTNTNLAKGNDECKAFKRRKVLKNSQNKELKELFYKSIKETNECGILAVADSWLFSGLGRHSEDELLTWFAFLFRTAGHILKRSGLEEDTISLKLNGLFISTEYTKTAPAKGRFNMASESSPAAMLDSLAAGPMADRHCLTHLVTQRWLGGVMGGATIATPSDWSVGGAKEGGVCGPVPHVGWTTAVDADGVPLTLFEHVSSLAHQLAHGLGAAHHAPTCTPTPQPGGDDEMPGPAPAPRPPLLRTGDVLLSACAVRDIQNLAKARRACLKQRQIAWNVKESSKLSNVMRFLSRTRRSNNTKAKKGKVTFESDDIEDTIEDRTVNDNSTLMTNQNKTALFENDDPKDKDELIDENQNSTLKSIDDNDITTRATKSTNIRMKSTLTIPITSRPNHAKLKIRINDVNGISPRSPDESFCKSVKDGERCRINKDGICWKGECLGYCAYKGSSSSPPISLLPCDCQTNSLIKKEDQCRRCCRGRGEGDTCLPPSRRRRVADATMVDFHADDHPCPHGRCLQGKCIQNGTKQDTNMGKIAQGKADDDDDDDDAGGGAAGSGTAVATVVASSIGALVVLVVVIVVSLTQNSRKRKREDVPEDDIEELRQVLEKLLGDINQSPDDANDPTALAIKEQLERERQRKKADGVHRN